MNFRKRSSVNGSTAGGSTSTCFTTVPMSASIMGEESFTVGDDSVFLPSSPAAAAVTSQLSQLTLGPAAAPGRPPKPASLRNLALSYPSQHSDNDNYENHDLAAATHLATKIETNNNCDSGAGDPHMFQPPSVDRRLKPERLSSPTGTMSSALTMPMVGPPVERSRKPSRIMTESSTYPGHHGMSIPGEDGSGGSEAGSITGSSDEQIYFYMPSIQTNDGLAPIMIPASELRDNAVQYLDLDFPATDSSLVDTSFNTSMDRCEMLKYKSLK